MPNKDAPEPKATTPNHDTKIDALFDEALDDLYGKVTSGNFIGHCPTPRKEQTE